MAKAIVLVVLLALVAAPEVLGATTYTVGDSSGWTQGVDYATWAAGKNFTVGDTLEFKYGASHSVDQVSKGDYDSCNTNPIQSYTGGSNSITLSSTGPMYFICPAPGHCVGGMKLAINVVATSGGSSPTTPSPPTTSPPGSTETPAVPPPPPGGNGASGAFCSTFNVVLGLSLVLAMVGASMY